jgi:hypothetical protein
LRLRRRVQVLRTVNLSVFRRHPPGDRGGAASQAPSSSGADWVSAKAETEKSAPQDVQRFNVLLFEG